MSRRESRTSITSRQSDALLEFENFKKKFLLANKHITKLNTTLSLRIEELQCQISQLYVENLRLRASGIAMESQLKREREKSRKIMADADDAILNLVKQFTSIRDAHKVSPGRPSPESKTPPPPRAAKRPSPNPDATPQMPRLARPPNFPEIYEDDEGAESDEVDEDTETGSSPTPSKRRKAKSHASSSSRLPRITRAASPPHPAPATRPTHINLEEHLAKPKKKRISRRQSGLLNMTPTTVIDVDDDMLSPPRPASPAFGSPIRRAAGLAEEEEERAALRGDIEFRDGDPDEDQVQIVEAVARKEKREKKRAKEKERETEKEQETMVERGRERERKRVREGEEYLGAAEGSNLKLKDVTNSPMGRAALPPIDTNTSDRDRPDTDTPSSATSTVTTSSMATRNFLSTPATTPAPAYTPKIVSTHLPTPQPSSSPQPPSLAQPPAPESDSLPNGREKRVRKSVNYAEPKLNTKMRKPDSGSAVSANRASISSGRSSGEHDDHRQPAAAPRPSSSSSSSGNAAPSSSTVKRKKSRAIDDDEDSEGTQADAEFVNGIHSQWVNIEGRRRSVQSNAVAGSLRRLETDDVRRHSMAV